jgi:purine-binding chemotaxis protein CheW
MNTVHHDKHVCCRIGGMLVGIALGQIQEINRMVEPTFVPLMEPWLRGVINLRGSLVTVLDLGILVRGESTATAAKARTVVVEIGEEVCGLVVDEVGDVVEFEASAIEPLPSHVAAEQRRWFKGLVQMQGELLLVVDTAAIALVGNEAGKVGAK